MKKILVIGSFMTDLVVQTDRMPDEGETLIGSGFNMFTGGKGANQAVQAARLGATVTMVGALGQDEFGDAHINSLESAGIDTRYIRRFSGISSGVGNVLLEPNGNNRIVIIPGANLLLTPSVLQEITEVIAANDIVVLQLEIPIETVEFVVGIAKRLNKIVILNPAPAARISSDVMKDIDYVMPNEKELAMLTGVGTKTLEDIQKAARELLTLGVRNVVVTLGSKGAYWINDDTEEIIPSYRVKAVDTTAAGDSFIGAFASEIAREEEIIKALDFASKVAAITTTGMGSQPSLPTTKTVQLVTNKELKKNEEF